MKDGKKNPVLSVFTKVISPLQDKGSRVFRPQSCLLPGLAGGVSQGCVFSSCVSQIYIPSNEDAWELAVDK